MRLIFSLVIVLSALGSCRNIKSPTFKSISGLTVKRVSFAAATIGLDVTYYNPNSIAVTTKEATISLYADSIYLGQFVQDSQVAVGKRSDFTIPLTADVPLKSFLGLNLNQIGSREIELRADGSVKVGKAGIFVNQPIHYLGRHRLNELKKINPAFLRQGSN